MKTTDFLQLLGAHTDKSLLFSYTPGKWVGANYHITEVKHIHIDSVDCGSGTDAWNETVIQLWESPSEIEKTEYMSVYKALGILKKVGKMKAYDLHSEVKIEYGNDHFHTAQLFITDYSIVDGQLQIHLAETKTDCKAKEACGIPEPTTAEATSCTPGGGCC